MLAASVFIFTGCSKTGPPGPQGAQGPQGPQGNANVLASDPFTVSSWTSDATGYYVSRTSPDITTDIVDYGVVSLFKSYGTYEWSPLPDINGNTSTVFDFYDGGFTIYVRNMDGTYPAFPGTQTYRLIVISSALKAAHPNTDWHNYKQVMAVVNEAQAAQSAAQ